MGRIAFPPIFSANSSTSKSMFKLYSMTSLLFSVGKQLFGLWVGEKAEEAEENKLQGMANHLVWDEEKKRRKVFLLTTFPFVVPF